MLVNAASRELPPPSKGIEMPPAFYIAFFAVLVGVVSNSLLMRSFHHLAPEEWKSSGEPFGAMWAPKGRRWELLMGMASRSMRSCMVYGLYLLFKTPEWLRNKGGGAERALLWVGRASAVTGVVSFIMELVQA